MIPTMHFVASRNRVFLNTTFTIEHLVKYKNDGGKQIQPPVKRMKTSPDFGSGCQ